MFVLGNFLGAVAVVLNIVLNALMLILLVNALLSWVRTDSSNPVVQFLENVSNFICNPIRRLFPTVVSGFDLAPMIAMLALIFVQRFLVSMLAGMAARMG
jgi:YggT family protein